MMKGNKFAAGLQHSDEFKKKMSLRHKGIPLTPGHRKKIGISNRGHPPTRFKGDYHPTEATLKKQSEARKKWFSDPENKRRFTEKMRILNNRPEFKEQCRISHLGKRFSPEVNKKKGHPGRKNPRFGKMAPHRKSIQCRSKNGEWMRSTWERVVADWFYDNNITYEYEARRVSLSEDETYVPDFYIPVIDHFVEVKGYWDEKSKRRVNLFLQKHDNLIIIDNIEQMRYFRGEHRGNKIPRGIEKLASCAGRNKQ